jgi:hypothetical protein
MGWVINLTPRPLWPRERDPVPIVKEAGWAAGSVGTSGENSSPPGFDPWTVQPVASRYAGPYTLNGIVVYFQLVQFRGIWYWESMPKKIDPLLFIQVQPWLYFMDLEWKMSPPSPRQIKLPQSAVSWYLSTKIHGIMSRNSNLRSAHHENLKSPQGTPNAFITYHVQTALQYGELHVHLSLCTTPFPTPRGNTVFSMLWAKRTTRCEEIVFVRCGRRHGGDP